MSRSAIVIIIIIIVDLSSVSWSRDHIGDALIDNGIGQVHPSKEPRKPKSRGRSGVR